MLHPCDKNTDPPRFQQGAPLSVIARTLQIKISDIMHLDNAKALGK